MNFTYEVGMVVCDLAHKDFKGTVTEVDDIDNRVRVQWLGYKNTDPHGNWYELNEIMPDTPEAHQQLTELTKQVQAKIDEATHSLEAAFKAWFEAAALQSGYDMGNDSVYYLMANKDLDLSKFEEVVSKNGWDTSSLYC